MTHHRLLIAATAASFMLLATSAHAQNGDRARHDRVAQNKQGDKDKKAKKAKGNGDLEAKREKIRTRIRALRAWKLTEALDLDEATAAKLFPLISDFDEKIEKVTKQNQVMKRKLKKAMDDQDAEVIEALIEEAVAHQRSLWDLQEQRFQAVRKVLTSEQAAKIFVVLPEIDRKIHREIRRAMGAGKTD